MPACVSSTSSARSWLRSTGLVAVETQGDEGVRRLLRIPGVDVTTAVTLLAVIGDVRRFPSSRHLVGYLGLRPKVHQSGNGTAHHGRLSKQGSAVARHVLDEQVRLFRERPLAGSYPYLWLDAKVEKVREPGGVRSNALVVTQGARAHRRAALHLRRPRGPEERDRQGAGRPLAALHRALPA